MSEDTLDSKTLRFAGVFAPTVTQAEEQEFLGRLEGRLAEVGWRPMTMAASSLSRVHQRRGFGGIAIPAADAQLETIEDPTPIVGFLETDPAVLTSEVKVHTETKT